MKNMKNMFTIVSIIGILSVQSAVATLSYNGRMFVEETKKKKDFFEMGNVREEWLSRAVNVILGGSKINDRNKDYALDQLTEMIDILLGAPLRRNPNLTDAQYAKIMFDVDNKVRDFLENLVKSNQQSMMPSAPKMVSSSAKLTLQAILDGALGEPYTRKANEIYTSNVQAYIDNFVRRLNGFINAAYPNESVRVENIKRMINTAYDQLSRYRGE